MSYSKKVPEKRCLSVLSSLYLITMFVSQILSYRFVNIGNILTVASVFIIPITYSISDLIAEQYGYDTIKNTIWKTLPILFFACFLLFLAQELPVVEKYKKYTDAYYIVFHPTLWIYFSNLVAIILGMFLNSYIIVKLKLLVKGKIFFIRSLFSSAIGELIFTAVVVTLVQFHISNWSDIGEMILVSFTIKVAFTFISAIIAAFAKPLLQHIDGYDAFEMTKDYNPFKFTDSGPELTTQANQPEN